MAADMDTWLEIARFLLIGHWYGTLVTVAVLVVLYWLHKLLLRYPLLDTLFPWCCDEWWCAGWRPEVMGKFKQCHLGLDFSGQAPNMCIITAVPVLEMEAAEGALEGVPFQTPRRMQSLEGAMNDNLKLRFLRDILFFHYELGNRRRDDIVIKQPTFRTPGCSIGADN